MSGSAQWSQSGTAPHAHKLTDPVGLPPTGESSVRSHARGVRGRPQVAEGPGHHVGEARVGLERGRGSGARVPSVMGSLLYRWLQWRVPDLGLSMQQFVEALEGIRKGAV